MATLMAAFPGQLADLLATLWSVFAALLLGFVLLEACYLIGVFILFSRRPQDSGAAGGSTEQRMEVPPMRPSTSSRNPGTRAGRAFLTALACTLLAAGCSRDRVSTVVETVDFETAEGTNLAFDISPDGQTIVIDLLGQLWLLPAEGGAARQLTDAVRDTAEDIGPAFSPDGYWIVFYSDRPKGVGLWRVSVEGGALERVTSGPPDPLGGSNPAWSPDGREIAFFRRDTLYILGPSGGARRSVPIEIPGLEPRPDGPAGMPFPMGLGALAWSPDGARLAFSTGSGGALRVGAGYGSRIWEVATEGGEAAPLTAETVPTLTPTYSPGGERAIRRTNPPTRGGRSGSGTSRTAHRDG
jgi:hypothetical protein